MPSVKPVQPGAPPPPLSPARAFLRGALTTLAGILVAAALASFLDGLGLPYSRTRNVAVTVGEGLALVVLVFVMPGLRDARYRRPQALLALFAGALVVACAVGVAFVAILGMALGGMHTD